MGGAGCTGGRVWKDGIDWVGGAYGEVRKPSPTCPEF